MVEKVSIRLGYFCEKMCHLELLKSPNLFTLSTLNISVDKKTRKVMLQDV